MTKSEKYTSRGKRKIKVCVLACFQEGSMLLLTPHHVCAWAAGPRTFSMVPDPTAAPRGCLGFPYTAPRERSQMACAWPANGKFTALSTGKGEGVGHPLPDPGGRTGHGSQEEGASGSMRGLIPSGGSESQRCWRS